MKNTIISKIKTLAIHKSKTIYITLTGILVGFLLQLNYLSVTLENKGLLATVSENYIRFAFGAFGISLVFLILYKLSIVLIKHIVTSNKFQLAKNRIEFSFLSVNLLSIYLFLPPQGISFLVPIFLIIISNIFYYKSQESLSYIAVWLKRREVLLGFVFIIYFNILPLIFLLFNNQIGNYLAIRDIFLGSMLYLMPFIIFNKFPKLSFGVFFPFLYLASLFTISHIVIYGTDLPQSTYYAIWETNPLEALEYLSTYFSLSIAAFMFIHLIIPFIILLFIKPNRKAIEMPKGKDYLIRSFLILSILVICYSNKCYDKDIVNRYIFNYVGYKTELNKFNFEFKNRRRSTLPIPKVNKMCADNETYILIIGESLSRHHMSLYGYPRKTNPKLESMKDQIYVFKDVISPHSHTNPVLKEMLTFASKDNMKPFTEDRSVMEYVKAAGYNTYWISNQQMFNEYTSVGTSIALQSDWNYFTNSSEGDPKEAYDEKVLKPLDQILSNNVKKKFIVIHLLGNHGDYHNRYPEKFNHFTNWEGIVKNKYTSDYKVFMTNAYDNSILYNDSIIYTLISRIKSLNQNSFLIYLSDHGEEVYDYREFMGHGEANASIYMFDIPFIVWLSDKYKENNPQLVNYLPQIINRKYQTDDFEHSLYNLMNLSSAGYDPKRSIFNEEFVPKVRYMLNFDYDELIKTKKSVTD